MLSNKGISRFLCRLTMLLIF